MEGGLRSRAEVEHCDTSAVLRMVTAVPIFNFHDGGKTTRYRTLEDIR